MSACSNLFKLYAFFFSDFEKVIQYHLQHKNYKEALMVLTDHVSLCYINIYIDADVSLDVYSFTCANMLSSFFKQFK